MGGGGGVGGAPVLGWQVLREAVQHAVLHGQWDGHLRQSRAPATLPCSSLTCSHPYHSITFPHRSDPRSPAALPDSELKLDSDGQKTCMHSWGRAAGRSRPATGSPPGWGPGQHGAASPAVPEHPPPDCRCCRRHRPRQRCCCSSTRVTSPTAAERLFSRQQKHRWLHQKHSTSRARSQERHPK